MPKYTIGVDFGSLSGRAILVDVSDGREIASAELAYPHVIFEDRLPGGAPLQRSWALQHPQDYLDVLDETLPRLAKAVDLADIIGIGLDCTASTVLPAPCCPSTRTAGRSALTRRFQTARRRTS